MRKQCVLFHPADYKTFVPFTDWQKKKDKTMGMGGKTSPEMLHQGITQFSSIRLIHST